MSSVAQRRGMGVGRGQRERGLPCAVQAQLHRQLTDSLTRLHDEEAPLLGGPTDEAGDLRVRKHHHGEAIERGEARQVVECAVEGVLAHEVPVAGRDLICFRRPLLAGEVVEVR